VEECGELEEALMQQRQGASTHAQKSNASRIDAHDDARENSELASRCLELRSQVQKKVQSIAF